MNESINFYFKFSEIFFVSDFEKPQKTFLENVQELNKLQLEMIKANKGSFLDISIYNFENKLQKFHKNFKKKKSDTLNRQANELNEYFINQIICKYKLIQLVEFCGLKKKDFKFKYDVNDKMSEFYYQDKLIYVGDARYKNDCFENQITFFEHYLDDTPGTFLNDVLSKKYEEFLKRGNCE